MNKCWIWLWVGCLLWAGSLSGQGLPDADEIASDFKDFQQRQGIPDLAWVLVEGDQSLMASGKDSLVFQAGSIAKSVVAAAVMQLVELGKLDLEGRVSELLPDLDIDNPWEERTPLQLIHLLEHSSGLDEIHFNEYFADEETVSRQSLLSKRLQLKHNSFACRWEPGTLPSYSNRNYALLALILEHQSPDFFAIFNIEDQLQEFGMEDASFGPFLNEGQEEYLGLNHVAGYDQDGNKIEEPRHYLYWEVMGLRCSIRDLEGWLRLLCARGLKDSVSVLKASTLQQMETVETGWGAKHAPAEGWAKGLRVEGGFGAKICGHEGGVRGFSSMYWYSPETRRGFAILANREGLGGLEGDVLVSWLKKWLTSGAKEQTFKVPKGQAADLAMDSLVGHYRFTNPRNALFAFYEEVYGGVQVEATDGGGIQMTGAEGWEQICQHEGGNLFRCANAGQQRLHAFRNPEGTICLQTGERVYEMAGGWTAWKPILASVIIWTMFSCSVVLLLLVLYQMASDSSDKQLWKVLLVNALPYWAGFVGWKVLSSGEIDALGAVTGLSVGLLLLSMLMPLMAAYGTWLWSQWMRQKSQPWGWSLLPILLANLITTTYLIAHGLLPFASWWY